jgi:6-phosphofructokinase 1
VDAFGHALLGSPAQALAGLVREELGLRARFEFPGDLQRMSSTCVSSSDRSEAFLAGSAAVRATATGITDKMVTLVRGPGPTYTCETGLIDLERVANEERLLPFDYIDGVGTGVTPSFREYAMPLIGDPLPRRVRLQALPLNS